MNWYKIASLIDTVMVPASSGGHLILQLGGNRYEYSGVPGSYWDGEISRWKQMKNKRLAGEKMSNLIRNLERYRVKEPLKTQKQKQLELFE